MKIKTKLWKRSPTSFATTIPQIAVMPLDEDKEYNVTWEYDRQNDLWKVKFEEIKKGEKK
ncbi:MAG: hypothetical protein QS98_C0012G0056 [archaeon GW2011_AR3]|nr:MAG: hypothetical protein QS98_C0012G0056 [archaeon GW2011_AR3]MBS3109038.1 hypothetical protein [Candidatus Woesearchaeota archaeon]